MYFTENEEKFMVYFKETMLPNRNKITDEMILTAAGMIGHPVNISCQSCKHNSAVDLLNLYNRMLPNYKILLKEREDVEKIKKTEKKKTNAEAAKEYLKNKQAFYANNNKGLSGDK